MCHGISKIYNKYKRYLCAALIGMLLISIPQAAYAASTGVTQKKSDLSNAQSEKSDLEATLSKLEKMKKELQLSKNNLTSYVTELDSDLTTIQARLGELELLVKEKQDEIKLTKQELVQAKKDEARQYLQMKERIRFMYERSSTTYIEVLFASESISDMLNKAKYIEQLTAYDRDMLAQYQETKDTIVALQKNLEEEEMVLETARAEAEKNQSAVESMIADKQEEIEAYETDIANKSAAIKEYEEMIAAQDAVIASLEAAVKAAEAAASTSGNSMSYGGGVFTWPAPSYTRISDDYGWRLHPTLNVQQFHNGVDMAAPSGSPILAAAAGEVVAASYSSTMGNYVMINHGSGLYTIYMHASSLGVSSGASVSKGQQIATVGSTGRSTGPHLHFGVRLNGSYVSPWNYLN